MKRKDTVEKFLSEANKVITELGEAAWTDAREASNPLDEVKLFNALTYLKKILEALSVDVFEALLGTTLSLAKSAAHKRGHSYGMFPYGLTLNDFRSRVGMTHPNLQANRPDLYSLFESVQPYILGRPTIHSLCSNRNIVEHDNLDQTVTPTSERRYTVGNGGIVIQNSTDVTVLGGVINGKAAPNFKIDDNGRLTDITGDASMVSEKVKKSVALADDGTELLTLFNDSFQLITRLKNEVYRIL